jgi:disulfide oxidoreductase YuzD
MKKYTINNIKTHLKDYSIFNKRKTTINHAFASALSVPDDYNENKLIKLIEKLNMIPNDLKCAYCRENAETWDHIYGLVKNHEFSGYGHQYGNLLPCCKKCNSKKGNKNWLEWLKQMVQDKYINISLEELNNRIKQINDYMKSDLVNLNDFLKYEDLFVFLNGG